jgi:hypothetical protein
MKSHTVVKDLYGSFRWRKEFLYFSWLRFATDYSNRVFGRESDMFPALWATAKLYQSRLGKTEDYCRGIWRGDFWGFMWRFGFPGNDPPHKSLLHCRMNYNKRDGGSMGPLASWSWMGNRKIKFLNQTGDICDDLEDFRTEYGIDDFSFFQARDRNHGKGYVKTMLRFFTRKTDPSTGYRRGTPGMLGNEVTIPFRYPEGRIFCAMDWRNAGEVDEQGNADFSFIRTTFMLLASAKVKGRTDDCRAALGLVLCEESNSQHEPKIWHRCGVFVSKPADGSEGEYAGGMKIFDGSEKEQIYVK